MYDVVKVYEPFPGFDGKIVEYKNASGQIIPYHVSDSDNTPLANQLRKNSVGFIVSTDSENAGGPIDEIPDIPETGITLQEQINISVYQEIISYLPSSNITQQIVSDNIKEASAYLDRLRADSFQTKVDAL